jgi:hypothetical protein
MRQLNVVLSDNIATYKVTQVPRDDAEELKKYEQWMAWMAETQRRNTFEDVSCA